MYFYRRSYMKYEQKELRGLKMSNEVLAWAATMALLQSGLKATEKQIKEVEEWNKKYSRKKK